MSLKDIEIKDSYDSTEDDMVDDFYIPVLSQAVSYDRIAGFFTSSSLAISSKGLLNIAENNGKVRLLVSPRLSSDDIELIDKAIKCPNECINERLYQELIDGKTDIINNYRELLAHLIAKGIVLIKVVLVKKDNTYCSYDEIEKQGLFHQKVGIIRDNENNCLTFSGSINETFNAWNENIEEFKTFKSWIDGQKTYMKDDLKKFDDFWNGNKEKVMVVNLPDVIINKFLEIANNTDYEEVKRKVLNRKRMKATNKFMNSLFWYQKEAVDAWLKHNKRLLFEMATGTGKTRTALACTNILLQQEQGLIVIIATPQSTLSKQWYDDVINIQLEFDQSMICDSTSNYKSKLKQCIYKVNLGVLKNLVLFTTHKTVSKEDFIETIREVKSQKVKILFIGDEVHGLGSEEYQKALIEKYDYRIGLSATPTRWFDDEGSKLLLDYFGNEKYQFDIEKALINTNPLTRQTFLTPYYYNIEFAYLNEDEEYKYSEYTKKIIQNQSDDKSSERRRKIYAQKRAEIIKSCDDKLNALQRLLYDLQKNGRIENTIIFTSSEHIKKVLDLLKCMNIVCSALTAKQGTKPLSIYNGLSERQAIIEEFKNKRIQVIVAIKCMDEGIDIPAADTAILMSSTTNPREYIQRIGRVIRRYPNKKRAFIYDLVVRSYDSNINKTILKNELRRIKYILSMSINGINVINKLYEED